MDRTTDRTRRPGRLEPDSPDTGEPSGSDASPDDPATPPSPPEGSGPSRTLTLAARRPEDQPAPTPQKDSKDAPEVQGPEAPRETPGPKALKAPKAPKGPEPKAPVDSRPAGAPTPQEPPPAPPAVPVEGGPATQKPPAPAAPAKLPVPVDGGLGLGRRPPVPVAGRPGSGRPAAPVDEGWKPERPPGLSSGDLEFLTAPRPAGGRQGDLRPPPPVDGERGPGRPAAARPPVAPQAEVAAEPAAPQERSRLGRWAGLGSLLVAVALVSGLVGGLVGAAATRAREASREAAPASQAAAPGAKGLVPEGTPSAAQVQQVAGAVLPAVVKVEARTDTGKATGSGVIFAEGGYVLTNAHVVSGANSIGVTLASSELLRARLVGRDLNNDLAVLKVRRNGLAVASFGRSAELEVGDVAIVVGSPFGFQGTVTTGIVSALHRVVKVPDGDGGQEGRELVDAIQTDAAINPGNSGGALANGSGQVVGISTAIATNGDVESNAGVGFAIPIDEALEVARALVSRKPVRVPFLGVEPDDELSPDDVDRYRLGNRAGALVTRVEPRSPAASAGLRKGDLVVRFGDQPVRAWDQLVVAVRQVEVGEPLPIVVVRGGRQLTLDIIPTDQPRR